MWTLALHHNQKYRNQSPNGRKNTEVQDDDESSYGTASVSSEYMSVGDGSDEVDPKPQEKKKNKSVILQILEYRVVDFVVILVLAFLLFKCHSQNLNQKQKLTAQIRETVDPPRDVFKTESKSRDSKVMVSVSQLNNLNIPVGHYIRFNAASYTDGSYVDKFRSSTNSLSSTFSLSQNEYVLFERDELPPGKAWCSVEQSPILTVRLSLNVTPTAVSYQHTKWYKTVPYGAPKIYDVFACYDRECKETITLASNCQYRDSQDSEKGTEQVCLVSAYLYDTVFDRIQFKFRENYGQTEETCAYLVRVYAERRAPEPKLVRKDSNLCADIANDYYNNPFAYQLRKKSCKILYTNLCCSDCPECCRDCEIQDVNIWIILGCIIVVIMVLTLIFCSICIYKSSE